MDPSPSMPNAPSTQDVAGPSGQPYVNGAATVLPFTKEPISVHHVAGHTLDLPRVVIEGNSWFSAGTVFEELFQTWDSLGWTKFLNIVKQVDTAMIVRVSHEPAMFATLKWAGLIHIKAASHTIFDHLGFMDLLSSLIIKLPAVHTQYLQALQGEVGDATPQHLLRALAPTPQPKVASTSAPHQPTHVADPSHFTMPEHGVPISELNQRYGMLIHKAIMKDSTHIYNTSIKDMHQWYCSILHPNRGAQPSMAAATWDNEVANIHLYTGFAIKWCQGSPSFDNYGDITCFLRFLAFHKAKGSTLNTLQSHCGTAKKVLNYMLREGQAIVPAEVARLHKVLGQMGSLNKQLPKFVTKKRKQVRDAFIH